MISNHNEGLKHLIKDQSTRIITITSGKGGVGKSNFALNFAISLANMQDSYGQRKRVVVMDADLGLANINVLLGIIPKSNLYHVIKGQKTLPQIVIPTNYGIDLIAGASGLSQLANLSDDERNNLIQGVQDLNYADFLIIDTGAGVSSNVTQFSAIAHETIVVTTPEPTSITDAYGVIKSIALDNGIKLLFTDLKGQYDTNRNCGNLCHIRVRHSFVQKKVVIELSESFVMVFVFLKF